MNTPSKTKRFSKNLLRCTALVLALIAGVASAPAFAEGGDWPLPPESYGLFPQTPPAQAAPVQVAPPQVDQAPVAAPQAQPQRGGRNGWSNGGRGNGGGQNYNRSSGGRYSQPATTRNTAPVAYRRATTDWGFGN